jgi:hypothetical protein
MPNEIVLPDVDVRLGRLPVKTTRKALQFADFFSFLQVPRSTSYWSRKTPIPLRTYGNTIYGDCTRAKQAVAATRMERIEQKKTIDIPDSEVIRVYREMSDRLYGGGDNGAYEDDALNEWRNPEKTFRDTTGHPYTIDAYLRINALNHQELKAGLAFSGAHGIAICLNLPAAFSRIKPPHSWDIPDGQALIGEWMPGSWGGHSLEAHDYNAEGVLIDHTWNLNPQRVTWDAMAAYCDEAHLYIDSIDAWRKRTSGKARKALGDVVDAVNAISSIKIEA